MNYSWIDEYTDGIVEYCNSRDIYEIYNSLNIEIVKTDKDNPILQENDALYIRDYSDLEVVFIRDDLPYQYEKFVLAHELGHALLHVEIAQAAYNSKLINKGKFEKQADYFALKLLDITFDEIDYEGFTIEEIAAAENIPKRLVDLKCMNLNLSYT